MALSNSIITLLFLFLGLSVNNTLCSGKLFYPGQVWCDTQGKPINAHGGGILFNNDTYYWYGEIKEGKTYTRNGSMDRVDAGGVSCYSSENLIDWKFEGIALAPDTTDSNSDLHISKVLERPKVIYNKKTKKFVMWLHVDSEDYSYARAGVAVSDKPEGPYTYLGSFRPNGQMSRDQTLFKDDNGKAYQIYSSENNATMYVNELSDDYLNPTGKFTRNFIGLSREAPAMVKHNNKYYLITSGCTGWAPNKAEYAVSDSILGEFKIVGNPCFGPNADSTYFAQSTFILPVEGKKNCFIAMFDRWNKLNLEDSRYVWLPLKINGDSMVIEWNDNWVIE